MLRRSLKVLGFLAVLLVAVLVFDSWRNPEKDTLDEMARAGVPGSFVTLPLGVTHYELAGPDTGRLVVLVHGFSVPYYIWDPTVRGLTAAGCRVLRYDLYGRGFSDRPDVDYDAVLYDEQLDALLDSLQVSGPIDLAGLSFGGFVTAHYVASHPGRVRTLTLIDPMSVRPTLPGYLRLPVIGPWLWQVVAVPGMADGQMTDFLHPEDYPTWVEQYRPQMRYRGFGRALLSTIANATDTDVDSLYADVAKTGIPVLLIWGKQDRTVPFTFSEVVLRNIPSAEFVPVDSAGHVTHIEQAALVNASLTAFLEAHPGPGVQTGSGAQRQKTPSGQP
jgi:pimeloyl-ACP methyl ester carboxylesterase